MVRVEYSARSPVPADLHPWHATCDLLLVNSSQETLHVSSPRHDERRQSTADSHLPQYQTNAVHVASHIRLFAGMDLRCDVAGRAAPHFPRGRHQAKAECTL